MKTNITAKVHECADYSMFTIGQHNRSLGPTKALMSSMQKHGWLDSFPMTVCQNGIGYIIIDGQHRFVNAKALNLPVKFVIVSCEVERAVTDINTSQRAWNLADYVDYYCQQGNTDYAYLRSFRNSTRIPYNSAAALLSGSQAGSTNFGGRVRKGLFKATSIEFANSVADIINHCGKFVRWARHELFVDAVSKAVCVPLFDAKQFAARVDAMPSKLQVQPNTEEFLKMIEDIYNYRTRDKIPLAFEAKRVTETRAFGRSSKV